MNGKTSLVAQGYSEKEGIDFYETFSPVLKIFIFASFTCICYLPCLAIHQMDVITTFLNGILQEEVYMTISKGLNLYIHTTIV